MTPGIKKFTIALVLLAGLINPVKCQDDELISPYIQLQYFKDTEGKRFLKTTLTWSYNRMELPLPGMIVGFKFGTSGDEFTLETDQNGAAFCSLPGTIETDADGYWVFSTSFAGNDTIEAAEAELLVKDADMEMELSLIDTVRTVSIYAYRTEGRDTTPLAGEYVYVYVPRMFSFLTIGELILYDSGKAWMEFPNDLPGDTAGVVTIIARIEEHPDFGNLEKTATLPWGVKADYSSPQGHRALWTKTAPKWMIYTLSVLLTGVWAHYLFALISLVRIRKAAKKEALKKEAENDE